MAARENQGLQIALIIFVILTITFSVTTYLCFKNWKEQEAKAVNVQKEKEEAVVKKDTVDKEIVHRAVERWLDEARLEAPAEIAEGHDRGQKFHQIGYLEDQFLRVGILQCLAVHRERNIQIVGILNLVGSKSSIDAAEKLLGYADRPVEATDIVTVLSVPIVSVDVTDIVTFVLGETA